MTCTAWAIPTYNVNGWKAPCYLMTDGHYAGYQEMLDEGGLGTNTAWWTASRATRAARIAWSIAATTPAARSARIISRRQLEEFQIQLRREAEAVSRVAGTGEARFNGVSIGKGHLAEAKAAINPAAGANGAFSRNGDDHEPHVGSHCGTNDTSQRDELLAKIKDAKKLKCGRNKFSSANLHEQDTLSFTAEL